MSRGTAVVTGASSGIGAATARRLAAAGFRVIAGARRLDRLRTATAGTGAQPVVLDVTDEHSVAELAATLSECHVLVNNAGGALGMEPVGLADPDDWRRMYEVNVLGALRMTRALLPQLRASGNGAVVNVGSTAGHTVYEGGAGYAGAKHALSAMTRTLRLELCGQPVRVTEVAPGMVATEEFSLNRFRGDAVQAQSVYRGVRAPLRAEDIAEAIEWVVTRPEHVNIDLLVIKPRAQAAPHKVHREA